MKKYDKWLEDNQRDLIVIYNIYMSKNISSISYDDMCKIIYKTKKYHI